jgi:pyruvate-formate lyase-activating enzyme
MVTFAFHCNIACSFCMVEDVLGVLPGTSLEDFAAAAREPGRLDGVSRIIFSGGEVTLDKRLPEYAALARSLPGVRHVRLQTNAVRLADRDALRAVLDAGVDEFFVSFHAPEADLYDRLVRRPGAFAAIVAGIENIADAGAHLSTNTAIVAENYAVLPAIVERVAPFAPQSMEFWNYWPRADEDARRQLAARVGDVRPHLLGALDAALRRGIPPVVKWFPRCLLGPYARYADDSQPPALIDDAYWAREPAYSCLYEGVCIDAGARCSGLSHPYVLQHGWEEGLLVPRRKPDPSEVEPPQGAISRSLLKDAGDKRSHAAAVAAWLTSFGFDRGMVIEGFTLTAAVLGRATAVLALRFGRGEVRAEVRLTPRDDRRPAFTRTASFDVSYTRGLEQHEPDTQRLAGAVALVVARRDPGGRSLPG